LQNNSVQARTLFQSVKPDFVENGKQPAVLPNFAHGFKGPLTTHSTQCQYRPSLIEGSVGSTVLMEVDQRSNGKRRVKSTDLHVTSGSTVIWWLTTRA